MGKDISMIFIYIYTHVESFACMFEWSLSIELCGRIRYIYRLTKHRPCQIYIYISCHCKINIGPRDPYAMQYMYMAAWGFQCCSLVEAPLLAVQHAGSLRRISDFAS